LSSLLLAAARPALPASAGWARAKKYSDANSAETAIFVISPLNFGMEAS
jgi:hypothetical protein